VLINATISVPVFVPSPVNMVNKDIVFWGCPSAAFVRSFVTSCYRGILWTACAISIKLTGNIYYPVLMTWLDSGDQRSKVKVTAGRGTDVHVSAGHWSTSFSF